MTDTITLTEFVAEQKIELHQLARWESDPDEDWDQPHIAYKMLLVRGAGTPRKQRMTVDYRTGLGWRKQNPNTGKWQYTKVTVEDVLSAVILDASTIVNEWAGFPGWCAEFGYDDDSIKARRTYDACVAITAKLRTFLGDDNELLERAIYNVEQR